jgi:hypothetical protein
MTSNKDNGIVRFLSKSPGSNKQPQTKPQREEEYYKDYSRNRNTNTNTKRLTLADMLNSMQNSKKTFLYSNSNVLDRYD